jgi:hypothetical protein
MLQRRGSGITALRRMNLTILRRERKQVFNGRLHCSHGIGTPSAVFAVDLSR